MKLLNRFTFLFLLSFLFITGCSKDDDPIGPEINTGSDIVYVVNEGNFMKSNSSLSMYIYDSNSVISDIYQSANGKKLGDVGQNMYIVSGKGYIVVNNSNKIVIIDIKTNKLIDTITTKLNSPRSICFNSGKIYVSNLYGSSVTVLSGENYKTLVKEIAVKPNPDEMILQNNKIYCCNQSGFSSPSTNLTVINPANDEVSKNIVIGYNPVMIKSLDQTLVAVLCAGEYNDYTNPNDDIFGKIFIVNTNTDAVTDSISLSGHPYDFAIDEEGNAYITGETSIIKINLKTKTVVNSNFISGMFYAISYESKRKELYISDPKDYTSNGEIGVYSLSGSLKKKFNAGIIPGAFCFYNK